MNAENPSPNPNPLPSPVAKGAVPFLHAVGAVLILFGMGAQASPDLANTLGWPAGLIGLLMNAGGFLQQLNNNKKTEVAKAVADVSPAVPPPGIDPIHNAIAIALTKASGAAQPNVELVKTLSSAFVTAVTGKAAQS